MFFVNDPEPEEDLRQRGMLKWESTENVLW